MGTLFWLHFFKLISKSTFSLAFLNKNLLFPQCEKAQNGGNDPITDCKRTFFLRPIYIGTL